MATIHRKTNIQLGLVITIIVFIISVIIPLLVGIAQDRSTWVAQIQTNDNVNIEQTEAIKDLGVTVSDNEKAIRDITNNHETRLQLLENHLKYQTDALLRLETKFDTLPR